METWQLFRPETSLIEPKPRGLALVLETTYPQNQLYVWGAQCEIDSLHTSQHRELAFHHRLEHAHQANCGPYVVYNPICDQEKPEQSRFG